MGQLRGEDIRWRRWRFATLQPCDCPYRCLAVACSPKHSSSSHGRPVVFLTCPVFFPTRSPASQRKPPRGSKTLFGTLVVLHPKSASRRRVPVVTANVMSPHAFVCLYALFIAFFFSLYLSLPRISRSDLRTRASTNAQLVYGHQGADLFVGGILLLRVWTTRIGILTFLLLCELFST